MRSPAGHSARVRVYARCALMFYGGSRPNADAHPFVLKLVSVKTGVIQVGRSQND